jgi:hypothetical protein
MLLTNPKTLTVRHPPQLVQQPVQLPVQQPV